MVQDENYNRNDFGSEYRKTARTVLKSNLKSAVLAGFLAVILCVQVETFNINVDHLEVILDLSPISHEVFCLVLNIAVAIIAFCGLVGFLVGSAVTVGYVRFNLDLVDGNTPDVKSLFRYFRYWGKIVVTNILVELIVFVGVLLFVIPGLIASYSLYMVPYILAENPEMKPFEAMKLSWDIMKGNRWDLFELQFSFIGWNILCVFTLGIGQLWLVPYKYASYAAFFRGITVCESIEDVSDQLAETVE